MVLAVDGNASAHLSLCKLVLLGRCAYMIKGNITNRTNTDLI